MVDSLGVAGIDKLSRRIFNEQFSCIEFELFLAPN